MYQRQLHLHSYAQSWLVSISITVFGKGRFWTLRSSSQLDVNRGITFFNLRQHDIGKLGWPFLLCSYTYGDQMECSDQTSFFSSANDWVFTWRYCSQYSVPKEAWRMNGGHYCPPAPWFCLLGILPIDREKSDRASCERSLFRISLQKSRGQWKRYILQCQNLTDIHVRRILFDGLSILLTLAKFLETLCLLPPEEPHQTL